MSDESQPPAAIRFVCTSCQQKLRTKSEFVGKRLKCPKCGHVTVVSPSDLTKSSPETALPIEVKPADPQALLRAIDARDLHGIKAAIKEGLGINTRDKGGWTPLHHLLHGQSCAPSLIRAMIEQGADVNALIPIEQGGSWGNYSPLLIAMINDHWDSVPLLLQAGADPNTESVKGATPLYLACVKFQYEIVELLVSRGADVNRKRKDGLTVVESLISNSFWGPAGILQSKYGAT